MTKAWIWVTGRQHYADPDGSDAAHLEPGSSGVGWTCDPATKTGDLCLLYRKSPSRTLAYVLRAESDAYGVDDMAELPGGYLCEWASVHKLATPVPFAEMKANSALVAAFPALRRRFQGSSFAVNDEAWDLLVAMIRRSDPDFKLSLKSKTTRTVGSSERDIEDRLEADIKLLPARVGKLTLIERQSAAGRAGRMDLLCRDYRGPVVIEIKRGKADRRAVGQIAGYMAWLREQPKYRGKRVRGILVTDGVEDSTRYAVRAVPGLSQVDIGELSGTPR